MHLELLLEEQSAEVALHELIPKILGDDTSYALYPSRGKGALLRNLPSRLRSYSSWVRPSGTKVIVLVDRDNDDCTALKAGIEAMAASANLPTRSAPDHLGEYDMVTRIACEELEAWFLGDPAAIRRAYPRIPDRQSAIFADPDNIVGGTWERLERLLQRAGYYGTGLPKLETARMIAPHMDVELNNSVSFQHFRDALRDLVRAAKG